jgi:ribosome-associated protein
MAKQNKDTATPSSETLSHFIAQGMIEKKATDVIVLDLRHIPQAVADFFVIGSGSSVTQVDAIADSVEDVAYQFTGEQPWRTEGKNNKEWVLLDYLDVVAHVFRKDRRAFYALEDLWGDAKVTKFEEAHQG